MTHRILGRRLTLIYFVHDSSRYKATPDRTALPQNRNCLQSLFHRSFLSPNKKPFDAPNATNNKANLPPRKLVNLFAKKWTTFAREFMAPGPPSKLSPLAFPRLAAPASIFLLLPARNHHPLARRKEDPRPNLPANGPIPRSASCVARVLLLPLPRRSLVFLKLAPASAVPKAAIALPRKPRKPDRTTEQSDAVKSLRNHSCSSGGTTSVVPYVLYAVHVRQLAGGSPAPT